MPMTCAHADGHAHGVAEPRAKRIGLRQRDVGQWRAAADGGVVVAHFSHKLRGRRTPAANEPKVLRHVVERRRRTVGH
jgi:hypothetical protein